MSLKTVRRRAKEEILLDVECTVDDLNAAIRLDGRCTPDRCQHKVAISRALFAIDSDGTHHVRIDGGHVKFNFRGYRYVADTPRAVKRSLMLFDKGEYSSLHPMKYKLRAHRTTKIIPNTKERKAQINAARKARIAAGGDEHHRKYSNLKARIAGFSGAV